MRAVLIGNPMAGRKGGLSTNDRTVDHALAALRAAGLEPDCWLTQGPGDASTLAARAVAEGYDTVIGAGGDGTIEEVAQPLVNAAAALGIMPLGSVMNLARTLGIPRDLGEAAKLIGGGRQLAMDVGEVNGRYFLEYAGVGLDAALYPLTQQFDSGQWSSLAEMLRIVFRYRPLKITLSIDGQVSTRRALLVVVANTPYFGPAVELTPEAKVDDRCFDVRVFDRFSRWELLRYAFQILRGARAYSPRVYHFRARTVGVSSSRPLPAHADIVPIGHTPVTFRLLPHALRVWANPTLWADPVHTAISGAAGAATPTGSAAG